MLLREASPPADNSLDIWRPWFAWRPVKVADWTTASGYAWVWWEWVEYKYDSARSYEDVLYLYRRSPLTPAQ